MVEAYAIKYFNNTIIPAFYSAIFFFIFLGIYKKLDFPKLIIKDKLKIKNEGVILLIILFCPTILMLLFSFLWEIVFKLNPVNSDLTSYVTMGFMWSMVANFKNYKYKTKSKMI